MAEDKSEVFGLRFLSNFLQNLRKYEHQQACPYNQTILDVVTNKTFVRSITDQCKGSPRMPWNQPNWMQPSYETILSELHGPGWPTNGVTWEIFVTGLEVNRRPQKFTPPSSLCAIFYHANEILLLGE